MSRRKYAEGTDVSVSSSRAELEDMLIRYGATSTAVFNGPSEAAIAFELDGRRILLRLLLPDRSEREFTHGRVNQSMTEVPLSAEQSRARYEKACRQKWRALVLAVKAKLVAVEEGVETFEEAFLAHVVMPNGETVSDLISPRIAEAYRDNSMPPLLPPPRKASTA